MRQRRISFSPLGASPGFVAAEGLETHLPPQLAIMDFNGEELHEIADATLDACRRHAASRNITWLRVRGRPNIALLQMLTEAYELHPLALEDVINGGQRPKVEIYEKQHFLILNFPVAADELQIEQLAFFLGETYLISFESGDSELFDPVRERIRNFGAGRIRQRGADYLLYALIDIVIDAGFPALDKLSDRLEQLEVDVAGDPRAQTLDRVHEVRRSLIALRRALSPQRDVLNALLRDEHPLITEGTSVFLRDCHDHAVRIVEAIEGYRDLAASIQDLYMSTLSNRMNDTMRVLTVIATIFIPLSFVASIYGMNFNTDLSPWNMPELNTRYGYPVLILSLVAAAGAMLVYFRRRGWW